MKKLLMAVFLLTPLSLFAEELAVFSIEQRIEGMQVEGKPAGYGDRSLRFVFAIEADNFDAANEAWYEHLRIMFGDEQVARLREFAEQSLGQRR